MTGSVNESVGVFEISKEARYSTAGRAKMPTLPFKLIVVILAVYVAYRWIDKFDPESVRGKRVLVTGASDGIGEQIAYQYAKLGAKVMVTARRGHILEKVVAKCKELSGHGDHYFVTADLSDVKNTKGVIKAALDHLGGLDILVLNHVAPYINGWWVNEDNLTDFDRRIIINFSSYVHLATHALPTLIESPGSSIIIVSSLAGALGFPLQPDYSAAKFGLNGFFTSLRGQFFMNDQDTSVTVCFLGAIRTKNAVTVLTNQTLYSPKKKMVFHVDDSDYVSAEDTALAIIKSGALKENEMFYPYKFTIATLPGFRQLYPIYSQYAWFTITSNEKSSGV